MTNTAIPKYVALIPAAGVGARMAAGSPKQYLPINGKPMLRHTLEAFLSSPLIAHTYVVVSADAPISTPSCRSRASRCCAAAAPRAWSRSATACTS